MSTANIIFKIDEVAKEFGFTLKEKQKITKESIYFCEASLIAFQDSRCLSHLQLWSINRNIYCSCFL